MPVHHSCISFVATRAGRGLRLVACAWARVWAMTCLAYNITVKEAATMDSPLPWERGEDAHRLSESEAFNPPSPIARSEADRQHRFSVQRAAEEWQYELKRSHEVNDRTWQARMRAEIASRRQRDVDEAEARRRQDFQARRSLDAFCLKMGGVRVESPATAVTPEDVMAYAATSPTRAVDRARGAPNKAWARPETSPTATIAATPNSRHGTASALRHQGGSMRGSTISINHQPWDAPSPRSRPPPSTAPAMMASSPVGSQRRDSGSPHNMVLTPAKGRVRAGGWRTGCL